MTSKCYIEKTTISPGCSAEKNALGSAYSFQSNPQLHNHCFTLGCHQPVYHGSCLSLNLRHATCSLCGPSHLTTLCLCFVLCQTEIMTIERIKEASPQHKVTALQAYSGGISMHLMVGIYFFIPWGKWGLQMRTESGLSFVVCCLLWPLSTSPS